jgi:hypothetical protein
MDPDLQPCACLNVQKRKKRNKNKLVTNYYTQIRTMIQDLSQAILLPGMISQTAMMANLLVDQFTKVKAAVAGRKNFKITIRNLGQVRRSFYIIITNDINFFRVL